MSVSANKKWYDINLTDKINKSVEKSKGFKLGLDDNIDKIKESYDKYSRKDINLSFLDRFTRKLYANPYHLMKLEFIQYIIFIILIYYYNPLNINTNYPALTNLLVLSVSFIYIVLFIFIREKVENKDDVDLVDPTESNILIKFISIIIFFAVFMLFIKGVVWILKYTSIINVVHHMIGLFIFIGILGIAYLYLRKSINKAKNAPGRKFSTLVLKFIMYLPCLLVDLVEYVKYQLNLTTKPVWILLGIEGGFIGLYYIIPYLFDKFMTADGLKLLNQPIYLSEETTLGNYKQLHAKSLTKTDQTGMNLDEIYSTKKNEEAQEDIDATAGMDSLDNNSRPGLYTDPNIPKNRYLAWVYNKLKNPTWIKVETKIHPQYTDADTKRFRYSYALSGWYYINPQPPNTRTAYTTYTNIIKYGNKVNVEYNGKLNSLRVMAAVATIGTDVANKPNDSVEIYETKEILYQKWNNIVINYDEGYLDVFINGVLVGSRSGVAPYMSFDSVVVGAPTGILGGICNVTYYESPLSKSNIELTYKSLQGKKEPYIWRLSDDVKLNIERKNNQTFIDKIKYTLGVN
jgi:hypothetical protein